MAGQKLIAGALAAVLALLTGCETVNTTAPGAVGIDREQHMMVSSEDVNKGAAQAYMQELNKARKQGTLNKNKDDVAQVQRVTDRLIPQVGTFRPDALQWDWKVNVESSKALNAFCMPGGKIMVYTGLIDTLDLSDAELAAVLGHEMSHALREHSREQISRAYAQQIALAGAAAVAGVSGSTLDLANQIATVTFQLPHSREQEAEADVMGLELMARAGYDPHAAIELWKKMDKASSGAPPEFLSTHPSGSSRIEDLEKNLPKVMPLYTAAQH
jgi:Zn-dependent protease with chaperone function